MSAVTDSAMRLVTGRARSNKLRGDVRRPTVSTHG